MSEKTPTRKQRLDLELNKQDYSKIPTKNKVIDHATTLQEIAERWASFGYYKTPDKALQALMGGIL